MLYMYFIDRGCKDDCDLITLGNYKTSDNYELNGAKDTVSIIIIITIITVLKF